MEEIQLTGAQFDTLLHMTRDPATYSQPPIASLISAVHGGRRNGHRWRTQMTEQDIETALGLFIEHDDNVRTQHSKQALNFFVRDSATAYRFFRERFPVSNVPRETSESA